jgi:CheY-like chemotaxis protein
MAIEAEKVILLVEDDEDDLFLAKRVIATTGVKSRVLVLRDGQEAVNYLNGTGQFAEREQFPFPSLILLDLKLPYRSGLEILAWMREQGMLARTIVAVLTGSNEPTDLKNAYDLGASTYLVKPLTSQMIYDLAEQFKLEWLGCNAARAK